VRSVNQEKPPRQNRGGEKDPILSPLPLERIAAHPVFSLCGCDIQSHLPSQDARDKSSNRVSLPASGFHQSAPLAPPDRFSKSRILAVLLPWGARAAFFVDFADFARRLAFLVGVACLPALPLDGATLRARAATRGFLGGVGHVPRDLRRYRCSSRRSTRAALV
jgi:hypothetical protein